MPKLEDMGSDRIFVHISLSGESLEDPALQRLQAAGHPVVKMEIEDVYDLGGQFLLLGAGDRYCRVLPGINPFDQPNVEAAKVSARKMVAAYQMSGALPQPQPDMEQDGIQVYGTQAADLQGTIAEFLAQVKPGDYIALQAFPATIGGNHQRAEETAREPARTCAPGNDAWVWPAIPALHRAVVQRRRRQRLVIQLTSDSPMTWRFHMR